MQWTDEGVVLGVRKHGETGVILEVMTSGHGRHLGLVHGGRSKALQPVLQPGNTVHATWRARLDEHLGTFQVEGKHQRAARFLASPLALYGLATLGGLLRALPERDPPPAPPATPARPAQRWPGAVARARRATRIRPSTTRSRCWWTTSTTRTSPRPCSCASRSRS